MQNTTPLSTRLEPKKPQDPDQILAETEIPTTPTDRKTTRVFQKQKDSEAPSAKKSSFPTCHCDLSLLETGASIRMGVRKLPIKKQPLLLTTPPSRTQKIENYHPEGEGAVSSELDSSGSDLLPRFQEDHEEEMDFLFSHTSNRRYNDFISPGASPGPFEREPSESPNSSFDGNLQAAPFDDQNHFMSPPQTPRTPSDTEIMEDLEPIAPTELKEGDSAPREKREPLEEIPTTLQGREIPISLQDVKPQPTTPSSSLRRFPMSSEEKHLLHVEPAMLVRTPEILESEVLETVPPLVAIRAPIGTEPNREVQNTERRDIAQQPRFHRNPAPEKRPPWNSSPRLPKKK